MAKQSDKDFRKVCREAARQGLMNSPDGKWIRSENAAGSHMQAGYRVNEYDHTRKTAKMKTGCCRNHKNWRNGERM